MTTAARNEVAPRHRLLHYAPSPLDHALLAGIEAETAADTAALDGLDDGTPFDCLLIGPLEEGEALEALRELRARPAFQDATAVVLLRGDGPAPDAIIAAGAYTWLPATEATPRALREALRLAAGHATQHRETRERDAILDAVRRQHHIGVLRTAYNGAIIEANEAFAGFLGYRPDELAGRHLLTLRHPDERDDMRRRALSLRHPDGTPIHHEGRYIHRDGHIVWIESHVTIVRDSNGRIREFIGLDVDRTELKRAQQALEEQNARFRAALRAADAYVYEINLVDPARSVAQGVRRVLGGVPDQPSGAVDWWRAMIHPDDLPEFDRLHALQLATRERLNELHYRVRRVDGMWIDVSDRRELILEGGEPAKLFGTVIDVTERTRSEAALHESERRLHEAMDAAEFGAWTFEVATGRLDWAPRMCAIYGVPPGTVVTLDGYLALVHPDDRPTPEFVDQLRRTSQGTVEHEFRIVRPDGEVRWIQAWERIEHDAEGAPIRIAGLNRDITERRRAQAALRESDERLREAMEAASAGSWKVVPATGEFIASDRALELHGLQPGTPMTHELALARVHPEDRATVEAAMQRTITTGAPFRLELRVPQPDGSMRWVASEAKRKIEGDRVALVGFVQDITERKLAENALATSERRFRALANLAPTFIWTANAGGVITFTGERWLEYTGLSTEDRDRWPQLVLHPDDRDRCVQAWTHAVATGEDYAIEVRNRDRTGHYRWMETRAVPLRDEHGEVTSWFGTTTDIHDRKMVEAALRESEQRLRLAQEVATVGSLTVNIESGMLHWTPEASAIYDLPGDTTSIDALVERVHPEDRERAVADMRATWEPGSPRVLGEDEYRIVRGDGAVRWVARRWRSFFEGDGPSRRATHAIVTVQDITERRLAEQALRESQERLRLALDVGALGTFTYDVEEDRVTLDARAMEMYGFQQSEVPLDALVAARHPDDRAPSIEGISAAFDPASHDGSRKGEYRVRLPDGTERWVHSRVAVTFEGDGPSRHAVRALATLQDITERKRLEVAQREFLAMASHELRNPLAALKGNAQLMLRRARFDEAAAHTIVDQADHLERLVRDLLDVTMATAGHFGLRRSQFDIVSLVETAITLQQRTAARHRIALRHAPPTLRGSWDADRLQQILANLLSNATKYSPEGGDIAVDIEPGPSEVRISVEDHGIGIPPAEQERIFQRFHRLQSHTGRVDGLGLGLDVTRALVEAHGGHIEVHSVVGEGSTFAFTLPMSDTTTVEDAPAPVRATPLPRPRRARLLVVDDDLLIQQLLRAAFEDDGYEVTLAADGLDALDAFERQDFDVVVLDLMMPRLDGPGLLQALEDRNRREGVRVVVVSASHEAQRRTDEARADALVTKPFELERLLDTVRALVPASNVGTR